jgi:spermidine synthase
LTILEKHPYNCAEEKAAMKTIDVREYNSPTSGIFFRARRRVLSEQTPYQRMEIYETDSHGKVLLLDGLVQTTERDEFFYHEMLVHPAMMAHWRAGSVLIIGGGDGGALREVLRYPIRQAVLVEIDARVIEACGRHFPGLAASFGDRRAEVFIGDGSQFIMGTERRFDVIVVDSSDPVGPSAVLHRRAFYAALKRCLRPGGVIAAQAGAPLFHLEHLRKKRAFLKQLFAFALYYVGPVPTYPGGLWCYAFLSDRVNPLKRLGRSVPGKLKYYNPEVHRAAFALPEFLRERPRI